MSEYDSISRAEKQENVASVLRGLVTDRGLKLFPVVFTAEGKKMPWRKGWQEAAVASVEKLDKWLRGGHKIFGMYAGGCGLIVIDTDQKHGIDGDANLRALAGAGAADLDSTFSTVSPTGSRHYYFRGDPVASKNGVLASGVDVKSRGGYVVAPGSTIDGVPYRVVNNADIAPIPQWLVDAISKAYTARPDRVKLDAAVELDTDIAVDQALAYLADAPASIEGQGGNDNAYRVACNLRDIGVSDGVALDLLDLLSGWNERCCPPWERDELEEVIGHAYTYAENSPGVASVALDFDVIEDWNPKRDAIGAANDNGSKPTARGIMATPFVWRDPATIPPREWLFGRHYIRGYATGTVAPGGTGKTALTLVEALSMATGCDLVGGNESETPRKVWLWNLEDPAEEIERRIAAAVSHHDINPQTLAGQLFVNSGRDTPLVIATKVRETVTVLEPVIDALVAEIRANGIDVLIVDPFVSSHHLPENDNAAMDAAVKAWARVAHLGHCAVELVHHSRKLGGDAVSAESARGGSAFVDGCRGVRVINRMSEADAGKLGVIEPRRFFSVADDKPNMAPPPAGKRDWYQLVSVELRNGDNVGAVDRYTPPDPLDDVTAIDLERVQKRFAEGGYHYNAQAREWGGYAVAEILGLDVGTGPRADRTPEQNAARAKVEALLRKWLADGSIQIVERKDSQRKTKSFYDRGEVATGGQDQRAA